MAAQMEAHFPMTNYTPWWLMWLPAPNHAQVAKSCCFPMATPPTPRLLTPVTTHTLWQLKCCAQPLGSSLPWQLLRLPIPTSILLQLLGSHT